MRDVLDWVARVLVIVGALNWGLVGVANYNVVEMLLGTGTVTSVVYDLVGLGALWMIYMVYDEMR